MNPDRGMIHVVQELRSRWDRVQTGFVDEPRSAVQQADELVASAMKRIAESFAEARNRLPPFRPTPERCPSMSA